jgi:[ribosomal protein S5]-alanine N-acetyltransferase
LPVDAEPILNQVQNSMTYALTCTLFSIHFFRAEKIIPKDYFYTKSNRHIMLTKLTTKRLSLNALTVEDGDFIQELVNTKGWLQFIGDRNIHSKEDAINYINKINATRNFYYWVVRITDTIEPIGIISFIKRSYLEHFDIGFAFLPQYNSKGYAYEAAKEILSMVKSKHEHSIVLATTVPDNLSSIKLLTKLGLHFDKEIEVGSEKLHVYSNAKS